MVTPEISLSAGKTFQTTFVQCVYTFMFTVQHACKGGIHDGPTPLDMCKFKLQPTHANYTTRIELMHAWVDVSHSLDTQLIQHWRQWETHISCNDSNSGLLPACPLWTHWTVHTKTVCAPQKDQSVGHRQGRILKTGKVAMNLHL